MDKAQQPTSFENWVPLKLPIPDHWESTEFEEAFENISLSNIKIPQKRYLSSGKYPVVDQGRVLIGGYTDSKQNVIFGERSFVVFGDHTKCFKFVSFPFAPGADGTKVLKPRAPIHEKFSYYACLALRLPDRGYSRHYSFLKRSSFPLPPLNEQRRIVAKIEELFSELDKGVESLKKAREQLKIYRQAVLKHAFEGKLTAEWRLENKDKLEPADKLLARIKREREARYRQQLDEWEAAVEKWNANGRRGKKPGRPKAPPEISATDCEAPRNLPRLPEGWAWFRLDNVFDISGGLTKNQKRNSLSRKMKYLRVANVYSDKVLTDEIYEIGVTDEEACKVALEPGDLLIVEGNGSIDQIGRVAVWAGNVPDCGHQNHLIRARLATKSDPRFFLYFLLSPLGRDLIIKEASSTSGLHTLSISKVSNLVVPLAPLHEERAVLDQIAEKLSTVDSLFEEIAIQLVRSRALRQSILKKAFSGQLVPQDPNDEPASILLERIKAEKAARTRPKTRARAKAKRKSPA